MGFGIKTGVRDLESGLRLSSSTSCLYELQPPPSPTTPSLVLSSSGKTLLVSNSSKSLVLSNSGKRFDKKKYVKQVTGRHNDTELHLAVQRGDLTAVRQILGEIDAQMVGTLSGADFDAEVAEIRSAIVNEVNELGETPLFTAAEKGHLDIVKELLQYSTEEGMTMKNRSGFDPFHIAASQGHEAIVQVLLNHDPRLSKTVGQSNATPIISAATRGHIGVVNVLLSTDSSSLEIPRSNGKNALHLAARQGHVEIVKALLRKDPQLARRNDKKGQTALHMAVKGTSCEVVKLLLNADPALVMLPDRFGNTALHVATRKRRAEIVNELVLVRDTNVNALTRDLKTAYDIAEGLPLSEETSEIKECFARCGALCATDLNKPRDELRQTVTEIKKDVHNQLEQARKTNRNMNGIAKELRKLHRAGINNATNSITVVAVLFATVAFAAIFTVPGGDDITGMAVMVGSPSFKVFFIFNAIALFTSLAVVVVQITVVRGETKSERRVVEVINKLMWLASVCTTIAFISSSFIVVGRRNRWAAVLISIIGGVTMAGILGAMTYYVIKSKRIRRVRKKMKIMRSGTNSWRHSESDSEVNPIYAI
ncbi:ankyrin repeat-containing protein ITN1-like isoform X2 [Cucurbita pepo subsp. pepo]|uniref:ankyrin repeat-containing protein ITN1-like isoform X2 n=1 Tax=Cucurbita pepo subsp. pepo TaxID=3664 RepID=UPI000C9D8F8B|nr:ankyrin repeat-containing protein ITN1-like isoform X2 [Cucurbita pepo subsp. pepo]XP_023544907.1 ankyrin repeat-containing protein ITN1-like isoform X2 [Cucurbita pepo subsp. pepo]